MRLLGIDYGSQRVGIALSDESGTLALPLEVVVRGADGRAALARVRALAAEHGVTEVVLGLPLDASGVEGPAARRVRAFGERLAAELALQVHYEDERLSSVQAAGVLARSGVRGKGARKAIDQTAAAIILGAYLERRARGAWTTRDQAADERVAETEAALLQGESRAPRKPR